MTTRFDGTHENLCSELRQRGIRGTWHEEPNGVFMFRSRTGANIHWSSTRGTLWLSGKKEAQRALLTQIAQREVLNGDGEKRLAIAWAGDSE